MLGIDNILVEIEFWNKVRNFLWFLAGIISTLLFKFIITHIRIVFKN